MDCCGNTAIINLSDIQCHDAFKKEKITELDKKFVNQDVKILYLITLILIINVMVLLFVINNGYDKDKIITVECLIMIGLALAFSLM
jgi:hypothetical protein